MAPPCRAMVFIAWIGEDWSRMVILMVQQRVSMVAMTRGGGIREHAALRDGVLDVICHDKNMAQQRMPRGTELRGRHGH